jgi:hypothetical protein
MFHFGSGGVAWSCNKRNVVALSTTEAEYYGSLNASTEANRETRIERFCIFLLATVLLFAGMQCKREGIGPLNLVFFIILTSACFQALYTTNALRDHG